MFLLNDNMEERISNSQKSKNSNKNEIILSSVKKNTDLIYCNRIVFFIIIIICIFFLLLNYFIVE